MEINSIKVSYALIKNKEITTNEAFLISLLFQIDFDKYIPNNRELSNIIGVSKQAISKMISSLIYKGFLTSNSNYSDQEVFKRMKNGVHINGCVFCGYSKSTLDEHHYPVRAKDGGTKTIPICPNCHREFHELADHNRYLFISEKTKRIISEH